MRLLLRCVDVLRRKGVVVPLRRVSVTLVMIRHVFRGFVVLLRTRLRREHLRVGFVAGLHGAADREAMISAFQILGTALRVVRNRQVVRSRLIRLTVRSAFVYILRHLWLWSLPRRGLQPLSRVVSEQTGHVDSAPIHSHGLLSNDPWLHRNLRSRFLVPRVAVSLGYEIRQLRRGSAGERSVFGYSPSWSDSAVHHQLLSRRVSQTRSACGYHSVSSEPCRDTVLKDHFGIDVLQRYGCPHELVVLVLGHRLRRRIGRGLPRLLVASLSAVLRPPHRVSFQLVTVAGPVSNLRLFRLLVHVARLPLAISETIFAQLRWRWRQWIVAIVNFVLGHRWWRGRRQVWARYTIVVNVPKVRFLGRPLWHPIVNRYSGTNDHRTQ